MKGITKKLLSILLASILATSMFAVTSSAFWIDEDYLDDFLFDVVIENGIFYTLNISEKYSYATVSDFETDEEGKSLLSETVVIPDAVQYEGESIPVTEIGYMAFADCCTLREITLPATVTGIYDSAFSNAAYLSKVVIPSETEFDYFGTDVFTGTPAFGYFAENCADDEIILGQNVLLAYLGNEKTYTVPDEIDFIADYCFFMSGIEEINFNETVTEILPYTFASCRNLKEITIPDTITSLGEGAFSNCVNLEKVNLGDSLAILGYKVFEGTKIKDIYIGASVEDIVGAFTGCNTIENIIVSEENPSYHVNGNAVYYEYIYDDESSSLSLEYYIISSDETTFAVPENVDSIAAYAFYNCKQLDKIIINSPVYISSQAFAYCDFEEFDFTYVSDIGYASFRGCNNLTEVDLSEVWYIEDSAFENCTNIKDVTFSDDIYYLGARSFANTAITEISVNGDDCEIGEAAFADCKNLKSAKFNDGVGYINANIFSACPELERVFISKTVAYIDYYAFDDCQDVVFEIIEHSGSADTIIEYAEDDENDVTKYEFVGKLTFFERIGKFFTDLFARIRDFFLGLIF